MTGRKTHEQFLRELERKPDIPDPRQSGAAEPERQHRAQRGARQSEFPVSEHGMNQESDQAKHNRPFEGAKRT